ncbi:unnamed protein product [Effrenium voratum]|uniref:Uncharacterized protein n=1 Tax=Effrenium voratum TaxID=2562239 RepID=A0AA36IVL3_9DINO|nr:unnamed protein product [Effrenium voratum]
MEVDLFTASLAGTSEAEFLAALFSEAATATPENFKQIAFECGKKLLSHFGGPQQYLQQAHPDTNSFAATLGLEFSTTRQDVNFVTSLPADDSTMFCLKLSDLSFSPESSTKPAPYLTTAISLLDEYLCNSFISESNFNACGFLESFLVGDPILLWSGPQGSSEGPSGWAHYVKGAARSMTLLFLASLAMKCEWKLEILHPALFESMRVIWARRATLSTDIKRVAFANAALSSRGSIRRAHDVPTWLSKLSLLCTKGFKADAAIKAWNMEATRESQLAGQKRVALLFLLSAPPGTAELLLKHTSEFGSQSAFAEDGNRAKLSKEALQEAAHLCQLLQAVQDDLAEQGVAATSLSEKLLAGDRNLEMELQVALAERSASWTSAGLTVVKELMKGHAASAEGKFRTESEKRSIVAGELEREEFSLMLKMFEHDIKAYANWLLKCEDHEASVYHAELQHKLARQQEAFRQAKACFQESSREWMATLACHGSPQDGVARIDGILRRLSQTFQVAKDSICVVALLNWSAPSLVSSENQRTQAALAGYLVNSHSPETGACIGLLLSPAHSYHRGLLWKQEESANKLLANSRLNMDMPFVLPYMDRADERDQRSMIRHGRLMLSMEEKPHSKAWQFWRSSALLSKGLLDAAEVVSGKDLVAVEDISDDALPSTTSLTHTQGAAEKVAQVGVDGCTSILRGALSSLTGAPKPVVLVVDLNAHTGDLGRAVVKENFLQSMGGMNLFYLGLHATQSEVDWALQHHTEKLAEQLSNGNFKPFISLPERNAELVAAQPPPPNLSLLAYSKTRLPGSTLQTLSTPAKVLAAWHDHSSFKGEFREFLQKTRADYPLDLPPKTRSSENEDDGKSKKRKINVPGALPSGSKTDGDGDKAAIAEDPAT